MNEQASKYKSLELRARQIALFDNLSVLLKRNIT